MASVTPESVRRFYARADSAKRTGEIYIYDDVGVSQIARMFGIEDGITAKDMLDAVEQCKAAGCTELTVYINSAGGDVFEGVTMHSVLSRFEGHKTVCVDGVAASIASLIAMAGDKICMAPAAMMMVHNPSSMQGGTSDTMRTAADRLDKIAEAMTAAYVARTKLSEAAIGKLMDVETWMTATDCVAKGFADEVLKRPVVLPDSAPSELRASASMLSPALASYKNLPAALKQQLFAQHPHLSQSPQSRAPEWVSPKPRASGKDHRHMDTDINEITASHERTVKAQASAHEAETKSFTTRLNIALAERDTAHTQLSGVQAKVAAAEGTIKAHEATISAYKQDAEQIFALTGKNTLAEARGVIAAFKAEAGEVQTLRAQAAATKEATTKAAFMALLDKGVAAGKITPAEFEQMKVTPVSGMDTATAFVETYFMKRDPVVKMTATAQPDPAKALVVDGVTPEIAAMAKEAGMDPAEIVARMKAGDGVPIS